MRTLPGQTHRRLGRDRFAASPTFSPGDGRDLQIVALGCSERAEERLLLRTNYWTEIGHYLASSTITLVLRRDA